MISTTIMGKITFGAMAGTTMTAGRLGTISKWMKINAHEIVHHLEIAMLHLLLLILLLIQTLNLLRVVMTDLSVLLGFSLFLVVHFYC